MDFYFFFSNKTFFDVLVWMCVMFCKSESLSNEFIWRAHELLSDQ